MSIRYFFTELLALGLKIFKVIRAFSTISFLSSAKPLRISLKTWIFFFETLLVAPKSSNTIFFDVSSNRKLAKFGSVWIKLNSNISLKASSTKLFIIEFFVFWSWCATWSIVTPLWYSIAKIFVVVSFLLIFGTTNFLSVLSRRWKFFWCAASSK